MSIMELLYDSEVIMKNHDLDAKRYTIYDCILSIMNKTKLSFDDALAISSAEPEEYWWYRKEYEQNLRKTSSQHTHNFT